MTSTTHSRRPIEKVTSDDGALSFDLLSQLTHMSILTSGGVPRDRIFRSSGDLPLRTGAFFAHVYRLVKVAGMEYSQALKLVAGRTRALSIKSLLLRFAAAISSGESERDFVIQERQSSEERYKNEYDQRIENLKKWTDAYAAVLVSVTLVMVVSLVATMMSSMNIGFVTVMACTVFMVTGLGVYLILRAAPVEKQTFDSERSMPLTRRLSRRSLLVFLPIGAIAGLVLSPGHDLFSSWSIVLVCLGAGLLPAGVCAMKDDFEVRRIDSDLHTFVRTMGNIAGSTGSDLTRAVDHIDVESMGSLSPYIKRLRLRLGAGLPADVCWELFREESGSELVNRTSRMFVEGVETGTKADLAGLACSKYALTVSQLRAKRILTASTFSFLTVPMHATMVFILVFVTEILARFNAKISEAAEQMSGFTGFEASVPEGLPMPGGLSLAGGQDLSSGLFFFGSGDLGSANWLILGVILTLTVANALAPKFASGGSNLKIAFHLAVTCFISGIVMAVVPIMAERLFVI